jgi:cell division protein FtsZ
LSLGADTLNRVPPASQPQNHENQGAPPTLRILPPQGDFFAKPARIYVDREVPATGPETEPQTDPHQESRPVFDPNAEMHLVIRENPAADGPDQPSATLDSASIEEPALQDELEEQKRIKAIRELKLRNLSYRNYNVSDPNNEYEQIPAYIRRGSPERMAQPPSAPEQLFSNITVKADPERDKGYLSSLNSFLDGKKPD